MTLNFNRASRFCALLCAVLLASCASAASVAFQQRNYTVTVVPLGPGVPASAGCDLIFVIVPPTLPNQSNQKFLCIPTDPAVRAVFDPDRQLFYRADRSVGLINAFTKINSTLINLDGTLVNSQIDTPGVAGNGQSTLESYSIPLQIDATKRADITILDADTIAYRTSETKVYEISRDQSSIAKKSISIPLIATGSLGVDYDFEDQTLLMTQSSVTDPTNTLLPDRLSAYFRDGTEFDKIILENNPAIPLYSGNASSVTWDVDNGDIYVLDGSQLIVFTLQRAQITSVVPKQGPIAGGTAVQIIGSNFPSDAIVFFDGVQASNIVVKSATLINCTTPPHATAGLVDVTMTGSNIIPGSPATLVGGYTYGNAPPTAALSASPTSGFSPLTVLFNVGASADKDGTISMRVIDFGDGTNYTFPADLTVVTTTHTYTGDAMFTATLTITDSLGPTAMATQLITVGKGGTDEVRTLLLKTLTMKVSAAGDVPPHTADQITLTGQIVLPDDGLSSADFATGQLSVSVNNVIISSDTPLGVKGRLSLKNEKFSVRLVKSRVSSTTYAFTYTLRNADLFAAHPTIPDGATRVVFPVSLTITTGLGRALYFGDGTSDPAGNGVPKMVVANVRRTKNSSSLSLVRN